MLLPSSGRIRKVGMAAGAFPRLAGECLLSPRCDFLTCTIWKMSWLLLQFHLPNLQSLHGFPQSCALRFSKKKPFFLLTSLSRESYSGIQLLGPSLSRQRRKCKRFSLDGISALPNVYARTKRHHNFIYKRSQFIGQPDYCRLGMNPFICILRHPLPAAETKWVHYGEDGYSKCIILCT